MSTSSWAAIAAAQTAAPAVTPAKPSAKAVTAAPGIQADTSKPATPSTAQAMPAVQRAAPAAVMGKSSSWSHIVAGKKKTTDPLAPVRRTSSSEAATLKMQKSRAQNLRQIELDLADSQDGLNLFFKNAVTTKNSQLSKEQPAAPTAAPAAAATPAPAEAAATAAATTAKTPTPSTASAQQQGETASPKIKPLNAKRIAKRQRQINIGKATVGYKNYVHNVPKVARVPRNSQHPATPDTHMECSKRAFDGLCKAWRRALHLWDAVGPFTAEDVEQAKGQDEAKQEQDPGQQQEQQQASLMRRPSWADMESSSDEDDEEDEDDEMAAAGVTTENPWKTHTKRKAQGAPQGAPEKHKPRLG